MADSEYLTVDQLVARWSGAVKEQTLANWRVQGSGPAWIKVGKAVLYPVHEIEAFEQSQCRPGAAQRRVDNGLLEAVERQAAADLAFSEAIKALAAWGFSTRHVTPTAYLPPFTRVVAAALAKEWVRLAEEDKSRPGYPKRAVRGTTGAPKRS